MSTRCNNHFNEPYILSHLILIINILNTCRILDIILMALYVIFVSAIPCLPRAGKNMHIPAHMNWHAERCLLSCTSKEKLGITESLDVYKLGRLSIYAIIQSIVDKLNIQQNMTLAACLARYLHDV